MATIVQNYGPIYGEVVNGTVQGRPNGSVYVPISNTISFDIAEDMRYLTNYYYPGNTMVVFVVCKSNGLFSWSNHWSSVAVSQDLANNIVVEISESADFSTIKGKCMLSAGKFNVEQTFITDWSADTSNIIEDGVTYYARAVLCSNGTPVATSPAIELVGVVVE